jgi:ABC-type nitrate/sulfonate/bicarbonate transport system permease component
LASHLGAAAIVATAAVVVELIVRSGLVDSFLVPPPSAVLASVPMLITEEQLFHRLAMTAIEVLAGAATATVAGLLAGWLLHRWPPLRQAFIGWVVGFAAAPLILLYPLFLIFFGRGLATIVAMSAVAAVTPIILKTVEGFDGTARVLLDVGRSFGLTPRQLFWLVRVPAALPSILGGVRLGLVYALIGVVSVEYLTNFGGLGELITDLADRYEMAAMYGAILFVMLVSAGLLALAEGLEGWLGSR